MDLKKLGIRALSGAVYIGIIIGAVFAGPEIVAVLAGLLAALASLEFIKITGGLQSRRMLQIALDVLACVALSQCSNLEMVLFWLAVMIIRFVSELYAKDENPLRRLAYSALTQIYIGVPMAMMQILGYKLAPTIVLLGIFMLIWISDTGAFLVGSLIGRRRLFERISPKKSWEGFWGGFAFNIGAAFFFFYCPGFLKLGVAAGDMQFLTADLWFWIGLSVVVTLFATWGDLVESLFKRTLKIKDSGSIIPGHGGILDRIDSILMVIPASAIYIALWAAFFCTRD